jgi:hypothetical protein
MPNSTTYLTNTMKNNFLSAAFLATSMFCMPAQASADAIPSCYDKKLAAPSLAAELEVFLVIDQTTLLDDPLKQSVADQLRPFLAAGNAFSVLVFSAFTQGRYTQLLTSGQLDQQLPPARRNDVSKPLLSRFDQCMAKQPALAAQVLGGAMRSAFEGSSGDIAKSDVLGSLKDISAKVRQSQASQKVVLLVSDMLENSSVSSFYAGQSVRRIDPARELKNAQENRLIGDFGGARVYVLGAGLLGQSTITGKAAYRDPKTMQTLASFWQGYFDKSKAQLVEFGQPALLNQIK